MQDHFEKVYNYIKWTTIFVFCYTVAITFIPLNEKAIRFADTILGFYLGSLLSSGVGYLLGASPLSAPKKTNTPAVTSAEITANITTTEPETSKEEDKTDG